MFKKFLFITFTLLVLTSTSFSQSITLESVDGLLPNGNIPYYPDINGGLVTFNLRLTNDNIANKEIANGFSISSPDGANWNAIEGDTLLQFAVLFDLIYEIKTFSTGFGADTVGFGGASLVGTGLYANYDEVTYSITIGPFTSGNCGSRIILDTAFYFPAGTWEWATPILDQIPSWDGPHIFMVDFPADAGELNIRRDSIFIPMISGETNNVSDSFFVGTSTMFGFADFTLSENISWLSLDSTTGNSAGFMNIHISNQNLSDSLYIDSIMVSSQSVCNSPQFIKVVLDSRFSRGDFNLDHKLDMDDVMLILEYFFFQGSALNNLDFIDVTNDTEINISDLVRLIQIIFF